MSGDVCPDIYSNVLRRCWLQCSYRLTPRLHLSGHTSQDVWTPSDMSVQVDFNFLVWSLSRLLCRFWLQWSRGLRRGSAAGRLLGLRVRITPRAWMYLFWVLCVVRKRFLRRAGHSSREVLPSVCVCVRARARACACDRNASTTTRPWPTRGCCAMGGGDSRSSVAS